MSKAVFICAREGVALRFDAHHINALSLRLSPDNISQPPPKIIEGGGILIGIFNPTDSLPVAGSSVCLGVIFGESNDWWRPGAAIPDGNFALFRSDGTSVEILSDIIATRTIWYVKTDDFFIASTSQRAIIYFLQSYEPNEATYPWMLSSGTLGPDNSWDRRIRSLPGDARLVLDRTRWQERLVQTPVTYCQELRSEREHEKLLRDVIEDTFNGISLDWKRWVLPLSGGYDSRAILQLLKDRPGLEAVTWGIKAALGDPASDAYIARQLAEHYRIPHRYYETDLSDEPVATLFHRFLIAGEGRVDHISGYMDGFAVWRRLFETGYQGVIRGDEAFGCKAVKSDRDVYKNMSMQLLSDYSNVHHIEGISRLTPQIRPPELERQPAETREMWRDRTNASFEAPLIFAALSDLKLSYVEIVMPLVSRRIIQQVRTMPDALRTNKSAFKRQVLAKDCGIRYAASAAIKPRDSILRESPVASVLSDSLHQGSEGTGSIAELCRGAAVLVESTSSSPRLFERRRSRQVIRKIRMALGIGAQPETLDPFCVAFRVYVIYQMFKLLEQDASALRRGVTGRESG